MSGYGSNYQGNNDQAQYLQQNYGYQNQGFVPAYNNGHQASNFAPPVSEEYMRQPASAPYPSALMQHINMPEPAAPVVMLQQPPPQPPVNCNQEPRVIIVQHPPHHNDDCCMCICRTIDWIITRICYLIFMIILLGIILALGIWLMNKYRRH